MNYHEDDQRVVELKVFVHTNFEEGETLAETGDRIADQITEDLRSGGASAGIELIGTEPLDGAEQPETQKTVIGMAGISARQVVPSLRIKWGSKGWRAEVYNEGGEEPSEYTFATLSERDGFISALQAHDGYLECEVLEEETATTTEKRNGNND